MKSEKFLVKKVILKNFCSYEKIEKTAPAGAIGQLLRGEGEGLYRNISKLENSDFYTLEPKLEPPLVILNLDVKNIFDLDPSPRTSGGQIWEKIFIK